MAHGLTIFHAPDSGAAQNDISVAWSGACVGSQCARVLPGQRRGTDHDVDGQLQARDRRHRADHGRGAWERKRKEEGGRVRNQHAARA